MNIKSIIASLVLGSSSVAMATPGVTFSASGHASYGTPAADEDCEPGAQPAYNTQPVYTQPVYTQPVYNTEPIYTQPVYTQPLYGEPTQPGFRPVHRGDWRRPAFQPVTLASGLGFAGFDRATIPVGGQAGRFGSLQITATGGTNLIKLINIVFEDGTHQTVRNLNRTLSGNQSMTLDLNGDRRAIRDITVYGGDLNNRGWRGRSSFAVTAR